MDMYDECLKSAYLFTYLLDLESDPLCFKQGLEPDFKASRSQQIGVGMTCLLALECYDIPWDQLEPILGVGKRFDYRGVSNGLRCIFESKGTMNRNDQTSQINSGLRKKDAHHDRGEFFDVELIISTHISENAGPPRILIADPEGSDVSFAFDDSVSDIYSLRHFARVMQFIGVPSVSHSLYSRSKKVFRAREGSAAKKPVSHPDQYSLDSIIVEGDVFVGHWYDSWLPKESKRYSHMYDYRVPEWKPLKQLRVFQGLREDFYKLVETNLITQIRMLSEEERSMYRVSDNGVRVSVFPDGTILGFEY